MSPILYIILASVNDLLKSVPFISICFYIDKAKPVLLPCPIRFVPLFVLPPLSALFISLVKVVSL
jgi:hypothetical protein